MNWKNTEDRSDERAVSPVIGVIMMVAVTVILAAVVSMLVLGMGSDVDSNPQATFAFEVNADDTVTIVHEGGDSLDPAQVTVNVNGTTEAGWTADPVSAGDSYTTTNTVASGDTVNIIWQGDNGKTATLASFKVP